MPKPSRKKKRALQKNHYLLCKVRLGSFKGERGVIIEIPEVGKVATIVDKSDVRHDLELQQGVTVAGKLRVSVIDRLKNNKVIVDLPRETLASGPRIKVPKELVVQE